MDDHYRKYQVRRLTKLKQFGLELVKCAICGFEGRRLTNHIKQIHSMNDKSYREIFPMSSTYAPDLVLKAGIARSNSYKSGKIVSYRLGKTKENCKAIQVGAEKLSALKKGKTTSVSFTAKGKIPWNKNLEKSHPYIQKLSKLATDQLSFLNGKPTFSFREDLGMNFRSKAEANFARIFKYEKFPFLYEPQTFHLSNGLRYTPDFKDVNGLFIRDGFIELKGWVLNTEKPDLLRASGIPVLFLEQQSKLWRILSRLYSELIPEWEFYKGYRKRLVPLSRDIQSAHRYIGESLTALHKAQGNTEATFLIGRESVETTRDASKMDEDIVRSTTKLVEVIRNNCPLVNNLQEVTLCHST